MKKILLILLVALVILPILIKADRKDNVRKKQNYKDKNQFNDDDYDEDDGNSRRVRNSRNNSNNQNSNNNNNNNRKGQYNDEDDDDNDDNQDQDNDDYDNDNDDRDDYQDNNRNQNNQRNNERNNNPQSNNKQGQNRQDQNNNQGRARYEDDQDDDNDDGDDDDDDDTQNGNNRYNSYNNQAKSNDRNSNQSNNNNRSRNQNNYDDDDDNQNDNDDEEDEDQDDDNSRNSKNQGRQYNPSRNDNNNNKSDNRNSKNTNNSRNSPNGRDRDQDEDDDDDDDDNQQQYQDRNNNDSNRKNKNQPNTNKNNNNDRVRNDQDRSGRKDDGNKKNSGGGRSEKQEQSFKSKIIMQMTVFDSPVVSVLWCGSNIVYTEDNERIEAENVDDYRRKVLVLTDQGTLMRSGDQGKTWINLNEVVKREYAGNSKANNVHVVNMQPSLKDSKTIYFFGDRGISFRSTSCGAQMDIFEHNANLTNFRLNRANRDYILALLPNNCPYYDAQCNKDQNELHVSTDGGKTWKKLLGDVINANWDQLVHNVSIPDSRIVASFRVRNSDRALVPQVAYSDDYFQNYNLIADNCRSFFQTQYFLFLLIWNYQKENFQLKVARTFSGQYVAKQVQIPLSQLTDQSFTILETSLTQAFISITEGSEQSQTTNVFSADGDFLQYTLSLPLNVRDSDENSDFQIIQSNEGVIIANVYDRNEYERFQKRKGDNAKGDDYRGGYLPSSNMKKFETLDHYKKTVISFDGGSSWHHLRAPAKDFAGTEIECSGECSLQLKGRTQATSSPIYSTPTASGIVIGTGNVGVFLTQREEDMRTYLSRDGGHTWKQILKRSHVYEISNHGALILAARDDVSSNEILFTWDEGQTWKTIQLEAEPFRVTNILSDPSNIDQKFLVYGERDKNGTMVGVVAHIDFTQLHPRECQGEDDPSSQDSDYEYWVPTNFRGGRCVFGRQKKEIRRKQFARCYNPKKFDMKQISDPCQCTEEDWECESGFYRVDGAGDCVAQSQKFADQTLNLPPRDCKDYYYVSQGYQQIPGTYCDGGLNLGPQRYDCPNKQNNNNNNNNNNGKTDVNKGNTDTQKTSNSNTIDDSEDLFDYDDNQSKANQNGQNMNGKMDQTNNQVKNGKRGDQQEDGGDQSSNAGFFTVQKVILIAVLALIFFFRDQIASAFQVLNQNSQKNNQNSGSNAQKSSKQYKQLNDLQSNQNDDDSADLL